LRLAEELPGVAALTFLAAGDQIDVDGPRVEVQMAAGHGEVLELEAAGLGGELLADVSTATPFVWGEQMTPAFRRGRRCGSLKSAQSVAHDDLGYIPFDCW
jgi:hypothetical protein